MCGQACRRPWLVFPVLINAPGREMVVVSQFPNCHPSRLNHVLAPIFVVVELGRCHHGGGGDLKRELAAHVFAPWKWQSRGSVVLVLLAAALMVLGAVLILTGDSAALGKAANVIVGEVVVYFT